MNETKTQTKGKQPDYKGDGVAVWINEKQDGEKYLSMSVLGQIKLVAWKNNPKPQPAKQTGGL